MTSIMTPLLDSISTPASPAQTGAKIPHSPNASRRNRSRASCSIYYLPTYLSLYLPRGDRLRRTRSLPWSRTVETHMYCCNTNPIDPLLYLFNFYVSLESSVRDACFDSSTMTRKTPEASFLDKQERSVPQSR